MCDSPITQLALNQSDSALKFLHSYSNSETKLDLVATCQGNCSSLEASDIEGSGSVESIESNNVYPYRIQLEQDVQKLRQQLQLELEMHAILENAIERNAVKLSCPSCLPNHAQELLSTISVLEVTVSKLEQEIISLHFQLSQERNERRLAEYRLRHSPPQSISTYSSDVSKPLNPSFSRFLKHSGPELRQSGKDDVLCKDQPSESTSQTCMPSTVEEGISKHLKSDSSGQDSVDSTMQIHEMKPFMKRDTKPVQPLDLKKIPKGIPQKGLWDNPNQLSEEMVRCMKNIFISLADAAMPSKSSSLEIQFSPVSPRGHLSSSSSWWSSSERSVISSWVQSPQVDIQSNSDVLALDNVYDPYRVRGKLRWADIGNYALATEVSLMSVGKKQLEYASGALRRFRILVEQLAKVNPIHLGYNEKLAFWINLYNALIMHAYLAYGVPKSDLKLFSLMQKAAYTVGGHSFSAAAIEYVILKMKPPVHRPQIALLLALHKLKVSEEQRKFAIDTHEPLVAFALSSGMYSSPAVRVYSAKNVKEELLEAQHDFIRASVGVSNKGKLLVPKMLHCFAKSFIDDSNLAVWISHYLPPNQAAFVDQCILQRRQSLLSSGNCGILHFDSSFRYLFLPDKALL